MAVCWLVALFVAMCAYKHGIDTTLYYLTTDAQKHIHNRKDYAVFRQMVIYRNRYVHDSYFSVNAYMLTLKAVKEFALKYCSINLDLDNKEFDEF